jgi:primosomal protein N' (replication factor Y)
VVTPRPLKLKRELARVGTQPVADELPIARLWVDTGVFHLDGYYDYLIPEKLASAVQVGVRVEVEFGSATHEAIVLERLHETHITTKLKLISKLISPHPIATQETLGLISQCAKRWAGTPYDFIRNAIPPRVVAVEKEFKLNADPKKDLSQSKNGGLRVFWSLPPSLAMGDLISDFLKKRIPVGQVLIVCSTERELLELASSLESVFPSESVVRLEASSSRGERYRSFLKMTCGQAKIGIGLRGSIFTPLEPESMIMVISESSEHLYEPRTPGWNARDVALLRSSHSTFELVLVGSTPSLEVGRLIENNWLTIASSRTKRNVVAQEQSQGSLLPSKVFSVIRKALDRGPVLALVPRKGYGNAVLCSKCRNIALCECGGRLKLDSKNVPPSCSLCLRKHHNWRCKFCQSGEIYLVARGIERYVEEIGRAFPNVPILNSSGDNIVDRIEFRHGIVISTPGAEPNCDEGYSAVAILEGLHFLAGSDVRAGERVREQFFSAARLVSPNGTIFVALDPSHPLVASLTRWDALPLINRELMDQESAHLPPYFRFVSIEVDSKESTALHSGIVRSIQEQRLPQSVVVRGPFEVESGASRITLSAPIPDSPALVSFVQELQRRRSLSHKTLLRIRVDPYSLT